MQALRNLCCEHNLCCKRSLCCEHNLSILTYLDLGTPRPCDTDTRDSGPYRRIYTALHNKDSHILDCNCRHRNPADKLWKKMFVFLFFFVRTHEGGCCPSGLVCLSVLELHRAPTFCQLK